MCQPYKIKGKKRIIKNNNNNITILTHFFPILFANTLLKQRREYKYYKPQITNIENALPLSANLLKENHMIQKVLHP